MGAISNALNARKEIICIRQMSLTFAHTTTALPQSFFPFLFLIINLTHFTSVLVCHINAINLNILFVFFRINVVLEKKQFFIYMLK